MASISPRSALSVAGMIVGGIGLVLAIAGFVVARVVPGLVATERARLEALPRPDPIMLTGLPGLEVLIEGRIAPDQPVPFRSFVAYVKEEERRDKKEGDGRGDWKVVETVTPPLHLIDGDANIRVVNANYTILFAKTQWRDTARVIDTNYSGLVAGENVFVHGRATERGIEAITVGSGTRASYLAQVTGNEGVAWWLGVGFSGVGAVLLIVAIVLFVMAGRTTRPPSPGTAEPAAAR
jgi:hypothetical protein